VWTRTDRLVADGTVGRSWYWGPQPNTATREYYKDAPGSTRLVQYFDKSRMEINNPNGDPNNPFFVTNGLLVIELISGRMQVGDNIPRAFWDFLNKVDLVYENGQAHNDRLNDPWYYASVLPISEPYWAQVIVGGQPRDVLIQAYERRVLTYTPVNPPAFQVEM